MEDLGVTPKNYRVAPEFDGYDQAFWQGFWDQFSYAILPQLADTLNAFAINEAQAAGIIEKSDEIDEKSIFDKTSLLDRDELRIKLSKKYY